jgi:hypothetical protein
MSESVGDIISERPGDFIGIRKVGMTLISGIIAKS